MSFEQSWNSTSTWAAPEMDTLRRVRNICCIGAGYVGGPTCAVIAEKNPHIQITVVDLSEDRIEAWKSNHLPIHEPGLDDLVQKARDGCPGRPANLHFSTDVSSAINAADLIFVSVNTPTKISGIGAGHASDLGAYESAIRTIAESAATDKIIVEKSTVPCRTADVARRILAANSKPSVRFDVLSNPEFLAEGTAIQNLLTPDRVLIGSLQTESGLRAAQALRDVYAAWVPEEKIVTMNIWSSELAKLAANAMLAQRISSINALSAICEGTGADIQEISYACGLDTRIGPKMLKASMGFGGSCFKKDVLALSYMAETLHLPEVSGYFRSIVDINEFQKDRFCRKIMMCLNHSLTRKRVAVLGFAYKKNTGDTRESPAISVVDNLVAEGAIVCIYDPQVHEADIWSSLQGCKVGFEAIKKHVHIYKNAYDACQGAHAAVIVTEWDEFRTQSSTIQSTSDSTRSTTPNVSDYPQSQTYLTSSSLSSLASSRPTVPVGPQSESSTQEGDGSEASEEESTSLSHSTPSSSVNLESFQQQPQPEQQQQKRLDWSRIATMMKRPMSVIDGRNIVHAPELEALGFRVESTGRQCQ